MRREQSGGRMKHGVTFPLLFPLGPSILKPHLGKIERMYLFQVSSISKVSGFQSLVMFRLVFSNQLVSTKCSVSLPPKSE